MSGGQPSGQFLLPDDLDAVLLRILKLAPGGFSGHHQIGFAGHGTADLRSQSLQLALNFGALAGKRARENHGFPEKRVSGKLFQILSLLSDALRLLAPDAENIPDNLQIVFFLKEIDNMLCADRPDIRNGHKLGQRSLFQITERGIAAGQRESRGLPHLPNAQGIDKPVQGAVAALVNVLFDGGGFFGTDL